MGHVCGLRQSLHLSSYELATSHSEGLTVSSNRQRKLYNIASVSKTTMQQRIQYLGCIVTNDKLLTLFEESNLPTTVRRNNHIKALHCCGDLLIVKNVSEHSH